MIIIMDRKTYQNEWKKKQRELNTPYAQRVRTAKRSLHTKQKREISRQTPKQKEKARLYHREYRKRPEAKIKERARYIARYAIIKGVIKRPDNCEDCGIKDIPLADGRSGLRMDHHLGYEEKNQLNVKFICIKCDGIQMRKYD